MYNVVGPKVRPHWERSAPAEPPVAAAVDELSFPAKPKVPAKPGGNSALVIALAGSGVLFAGVLGVLVWMATRGGSTAGRDRKGPEKDAVESVSARPPTPSVRDESTPKADAAGPPTVTGLRLEPAAIQLLAGGGWAPVDVTVERTGSGPVTVEVSAPDGIEVNPATIVMESTEPGRFELRAVGTAPVRSRSTVRVSVRETNVHRTIPVTINRLDFEVSLASPGEIVLAAAQEKSVELRIDRTGGYAGPLTISMPATGLVGAATVNVPAEATTATISFATQPDARPGAATLRLHIVADNGGASHDLGVSVRIPPVAEVRSFEGHTGTVTCATVSADGRLALTGGADGTVRLWDMTTASEKWSAHVHNHPTGTRSVAFSPDGHRAISGGGGGAVEVFDLASGKNTACEKIHIGAVWLVHFDDAKTAHSISGDKTVHWIVDTGKPRQVPDGRPDLIMGQKHKPDVSEGEELKPTTRIPTDTGEFLFSGVGGRFVAIFERGTAVKPEPRTTARPGARPKPVTRLAPAEKAIPRHIAQTPVLPSPAKLIAISGDGGRVLTVGEDNGVRLWEVSGPGSVGRLARLVPGFPWTPEYDVTAAALDGDGRQMLLGGPNGMLKLWRCP
jgi:hypothetical protein